MNSALLKSDKQFWETPPKIFNELNEEFGFTLDPCAEPETAKCEKYYTIHDNGLYQSWEGETVFVNPPYGSHLKKWIAKLFRREKAKYYSSHVDTVPNRYGLFP